MAFPTTSLLDDFNRANNTTLGPNWSTGVESGYPDISITSNQAGPDGGNVWGTQFAANQEVWVTVAVMPISSVCRVYARVQNPGTGGFSAYAWEIDFSGAYMVKYLSGSQSFPSISGGSGDGTITAGDKLGIQCIGSAISMYKFTGGAWSLVGTATDTDIPGAGYIGLDHHSNVPRFDDFGGGAIASWQEIGRSGEPFWS